MFLALLKTFERPKTSSRSVQPSDAGHEPEPNAREPAVIVKIIQGGAFRGLGAYLFEPQSRSMKAANDFEQLGGYLTGRESRVDWHAVRNLATDDPGTAIHDMCQTLYRQAELKQAAGITSKGRKLQKPVMHVVLSWEEGASPDRAHMMDAANDYLRTIGLADYQAIMVAHKDTGNRHLHIMVNRVSPKDGRAASLSFSKERSQAWALSYEQKQQRIVCPAREMKALMRRMGKSVKTPKSYHYAEWKRRMKAAANGNVTPYERWLAEQKEKDAPVYRRIASLKAEQAARAARLNTRWLKIVGRAADRQHRRFVAMAANVRQDMDLARLDLGKAHRIERQRFREREGNVAGRLMNASDALKAVRKMTGKVAWPTTMRALASGDYRFRVMRDYQSRQEQGLDRAERRQIEEVERLQRAAFQRLKSRAEEKKGQKRAVDAKIHAQQMRAARAALKARNEERLASYQALMAEQITRRQGQAQAGFSHAAAPAQEPRKAFSLAAEVGQRRGEARAPTQQKGKVMPYRTGEDGRPEYVDPNTAEAPKRTIDGQSPFEAGRAAAEKTAARQAPPSAKEIRENGLEVPPHLLNAQNGPKPDITASAASERKPFSLADWVASRERVRGQAEDKARGQAPEAPTARPRESFLAQALRGQAPPQTPAQQPAPRQADKQKAEAEAPARKPPGMKPGL